MSVFECFPATSDRFVLAEGPVWVATTSTILWVDVEAGAVLEGLLDKDTIRQTRRLDFESTVGAVVPGHAGSLLVAAHDRLVLVTADGARLDGPAVIPPGVRSRLNDGACDPRGRLLIGTLALDDRDDQERLCRLNVDGTLTIIDSDLSLSNGLAWSPDGTLLFSVDSLRGLIWVRDYDAMTGETGKRREHLHIEHGLPDGIAIDSRGYLWVAIWGASEVRSFTPSGVLADVVRVPAPHVSSVAFVGDGLDVLLITTASRDLTESQLRQYPDAGRLFLADVHATGLPTPAWSPTRTGTFVNH